MAHPARIYDVWLGGKDNYPADRAAAAAGLEAFPSTISSVRANRAFLARAVEYLAGEEGIRQFLDIGTGLPSANNTHEVAQKTAAESHVVYVDNDPVVMLHAQALLTSSRTGCDQLHRGRPARSGNDPRRGGAARWTSPSRSPSCSSR